jgi:hypothetical protein
MSNFWSKKLAGYPPTTVAPRVNPLDTWSNKDSGYNPPGGAEVVLHRQTVATSSKAQSSRETDRCPECNSENYMRPGSSTNLAKRCYDCGYPLQQSGSGVGSGSVSGSGAATPARQLARVKNSTYSGLVIGKV